MKKNSTEIETYLEHKAKRIQEISFGLRRDLVELGRHLNDAKQIVGHGKWNKWLKGNTDLCDKTAQNIINYYRLSLGHPELMSFNRSVIYRLGSSGYPDELKDQLSEYMKQNNADLTLKNALALRTAYMNGQIELDGSSISKYLTKKGNTSQVEKLKKDGDRINKIIDKEIQSITKSMRMKIDIDGDVKESYRYWNTLKGILSQATNKIDELNNTFNIELVEIKYSKIKTKLNIELTMSLFNKKSYESCISKLYVNNDYKNISTIASIKSSYQDLLNVNGGLHYA